MSKFNDAPTVQEIIDHAKRNTAANFIGVQKGIGQDFDLYNVDAPWSKAHGTTIMFACGTDQRRVLDMAIDKVVRAATSA